MPAFIQRIWGYLVAALAGVAAVVLVYLRGRSAGRADERLERQERINEQAAQARQEVRHVQEETARKDDDAIAAELKSQWVRGPGAGRR
ncbi:MAG: hypothetical protein ACN6OP_00525 [Pseudomonadales bacterium]